MKLIQGIIVWGIILSTRNGAGQLARFRLDDDGLGGSPGSLPPGINPPGEDASSGPGGCCAGLPIATPMPEIPLPTCPGGLPPVFAPEGGVISCLPTSETCPPNSACWYNGIDYYCCPMEPAAGYGLPPPAPPSGYGRPGGAGKPPGERVGKPPAGKGGNVNPPGTLPKGISPPSDSGESSEEATVPGTIPKGIHPPSDSTSTESGEEAKPPGSLPKGIRPPSSTGGGAPKPGHPWKQKARPRGYGGGLQPPPFGSGGFPNPFTCCGGGFQAPSHLPRNINAPSERAIGYIQFHGGHNVWPPKETGKAKFGGPIKPDFLWFPGHHPHFTNELACCGGEGGGGGSGPYGGGSAGKPGVGKPQGDPTPPPGSSRS